MYGCDEYMYHKQGVYSFTKEFCDLNSRTLALKKRCKNENEKKKWKKWKKNEKKEEINGEKKEKKRCDGNLI